MKLLVDVGNTRLKWATCENGNMRPGGVFAHAGAALAPALQHEWAALRGVEAVFAASVVAPERERELAACVRARFGLGVAFPRSPAFAFGVRNAYAEPQRLGVDRFLGLVAIHAQQPRAQVLVSVGTALTADALGADGRHEGGIILASPALMRAALLGRTARIGESQGRWNALPDNTADGVFAGSLYAAAGAIERFRAAAAERLAAVPALILAGGGHDALLPLLPDAATTHDLVLRGLALWAAAPPSQG